MILVMKYASGVKARTIEFIILSKVIFFEVASVSGFVQGQTATLNRTNEEPDYTDSTI
jgi:hypothetical protein